MTRRLTLTYLMVAGLVVLAVVIPFGYLSRNQDGQQHRTWWALAVVGVAVVVACVALGLVVSRSMRQSVADLQAAAERLAGGDLTARADEHRTTKELTALATSFNTMAGELESMVQSQRAFVADASHQLRTPLTALQFQLENVAASVEGDPRYWTDAALGRLRRLGSLVEGLLVLARLDGDPAPGTAVQLDPREVIAARLDVWRPIAAEHDATVMLLDRSASGSTGALTDYDVLVVAGHLEQMLDNLVENAARAAPGTEICIDIVSVGDTAEIHVIDDGVGMSPQDRARAFDRFWRSPRMANAAGSGLGLAIVRRLAESNGGTADLRESPTGGIDAVVTLPAVARVPQPQPLSA